MADNLSMTESESKEFELMSREDEGGTPDPAPAPAPPTPAPETPPAPGGAAPSAEAPKPPDKPTRLVPIDALHEERERRKGLERELATLRAPQPPARAADPDIDETQDPIGAIAALKAEIRESKEREAESKRASDQLNEVAEKVGNRIQAYKAEHPEYDEQIQFLRRSRFDELSELGYDQPSAIRQLQQEEIIIGIQALQNDWDPGAKIAQLARLRGWRPTEAEAEPKPNGAAPAAPPAPANREAEARMTRLERGQRAAVSSSAGGGSGPEAGTSLEEGLRLTGAAFDSWWKKNAEQLMR